MADRAGSGDRSTTATVLFTDLKGSTEIRRALGDDRADELRRRHDDAIRSAAADHDGETVKGTVDGLMIVFGAAGQAVAGAVSIQRAIDRLGRERGLDVALAVRVGLSAGDVAWDDDDCFGTAVVEAARLCDAAGGGRILVSEVVRLLAGSRGGHVFEPVGTLELKGLGPLAAYEVVWAPDVTDGPPPLPLPLSLTSVDSSLPLVGRAPEREQLVTAWKRSAEGTPQVVLVGGEPGVGKTRLVGELARGAHADGAVVLFGRCDEEMGVPYQPFAEALGTFAAATPDDDALRRTLGPSSAELVRLVPSLGTRLHLPEPVRADPETERYRLFEAVTAWLATVSADAPVVLFLDDLHWAARPTLLLLRHLVRHRDDHPVLVVATYRDTDLARGHPLSEALADLRREPDVHRIALRGLGEDEVVELVASAAGHELDGPGVQLAQEVHGETEGNPFFIGQVLRHLVETGAVQDVEGRWIVSPHRAVGIPEGVREVIGKRLSQLAPETNDVLSVAAVIGREFDSALLVRASGLDGERVLDALEEAETSRLVLPLGGREDRRTFAHALVRSTLYEEIPTTRRLRIHRRIAEALAERSERGVPCLDQLAHHSCEAAALGDVEGAIRWSRAAAEEAFARVAYEEAATWYQRALDVIDPHDPAQLADRVVLAIAVGRALRAGGSVEASRAVGLSAAADARRAGRPDLLTEAALLIAGDRGWSEAGLVDDELVALLEESLETLPPGDSRLRAMAMARLGSELYFRESQSDRRHQLTSAAVEMVRRLDDVDASVFVLGCALWGDWVPENPRERRAKALEVLDLARAGGNLFHQLTGLIWSAICEAELGNGAAFRQSLARERELARELRQPEWLWVSGVHDTALALMEARFDDAQVLMDEALRIGMTLGSETVMQMYGIQAMAMARARGQLEVLLPTLQAMVAQFPLIPSWRCGLAYLYRDLGQPELARPLLDELAATAFQEIPRDANWTVGISLLATVCATLGDVEQSAVLYDLLLPSADFMVLAGMPADVFGSVHAPLMHLAATLDRWDDAAAHFSAAQAANERMGCRTFAILDRFEWGRLLLAHEGPTGGGPALLRACRDEAAGVGMPRVVALCDEELAGVTDGDR